jgi:hypothetical protein
MHYPLGPAWAQVIEHSALGSAMRDSLLAYPAVNLMHIFGLVLLVGPIIALDLRVLGLGQAVSLPAASRLLTPIAVTGLVLMILTGPLLFAADAGPLAEHPLMQTKIALAAFAVVNAVAFRVLWRRRLASWDTAPPLLGRVQAMTSITAWMMVAACGRLIAYV